MINKAWGKATPLVIKKQVILDDGALEEKEQRNVIQVAGVFFSFIYI